MCVRVFSSVLGSGCGSVSCQWCVACCGGGWTVQGCSYFHVCSGAVTRIWQALEQFVLAAVLSKDLSPGPAQLMFVGSYELCAAV